MDSSYMEIIDRYTKNIAEIFSCTLTGIYLSGSAAMGDFSSGKSDINICVVLRNAPSINQIILLQLIHRYFSRKYPKIPFSSRYIIQNHISCPRMRTQPHYHYYDHKMHYNNHYTDDITWFTLKKFGITLYGTRLKYLNIPVFKNNIERFIREKALPSWQNWLIQVRKHNKYLRRLSLTDDFTTDSVCYIVQNYYFITHQMLFTKTQAVECILPLAPPATLILLQDVLRIRRSKPGKLYASPFQRRKDLFLFMEWMVPLLEKAIENQRFFSPL